MSGALSFAIQFLFQGPAEVFSLSVIHFLCLYTCFFERRGGGIRWDLVSMLDVYFNPGGKY